ncbi:hypothetical protein [Aneurinibacillus sp. REN35]|uniref:hypothetical protein n=1 Tax=Aneurinibacillus sp. REN35 TaxID=3237286 RepID=UPI003526D6A6
METLKLKRNRDAWATIRGYVYQVDLTIEHWINLRDSQILELERGEDIDVVTVLAGLDEQYSRVLGQVKHREKNITLRTSEALEALANYYEHVQLNPSCHLAFRFITNAEIGKEKPALFPKQAAITVWELIRALEVLDTDSLVNLKLIRNFLVSSTKPKAIEKQTWQKWQQFLSSVTDNEFFEYVRGFTWSTRSTEFNHLKSKIESLLVEKHIAETVDVATSIYERLFFNIFKKLSKPGVKTLTKAELEIEARKVVSSQEDINLLNQLRFVWSQLEEKVDRIECTVGEQQNQVRVLQNHVTKLREEVGFNATIDLSVQRPVLDIPVLDQVIQRDDTVTWLIKEMRSVTWCALTGDYGSGKTNLAVLLARKLGSVRGWIRLRDLSASHAYLRIDDALLELTGVKPGTNWSQWYEDVCRNFAASGDMLIFLDDLPRTNGKHMLDEKLLMLAKACDSVGIKILSTSAYPLHKSFYTILEENKVKQYEVPRFIEKDVEELFRLHKAPDEFRSNSNFITFVTLLTKGHPVLVTAATHYFINKNWIIDKDTFGALFKGEYAGSLIEEMQFALLNNLEDAETREFLYRLTLVRAPFDREQIQKISEVPPVISHPFEKVFNISGLWIQKDTETNYLVSPLLTQLGTLNLDMDTIKKVNHVLGLHIVHKRTIDPMDGVRAIGYFVAAEAYKEAGLTLIVSLDQLEQHKVYKDVWGFTSIWADTSLPDQMDYETKLALRTKQIMVFQKMGKSITYLLQDLDCLLTSVEDSNSTVVFITMLYAASLHALDNAEKANTYLIHSLNILDANTKELDDEFNKFHLASLIWVTGAGVRTSSELRLWLEALRSMTPEQLSYAVQSELYYDSCINICDRIWTQESEKEKGIQNWQQVLYLLEDVSNCAEDLNLDILLACSIRGRIIVYAEYLNNISYAHSLAITALDHTSFNDVDLYVIKDAIGRQYVYKKDYMEAIRWLTEALKTEISLFPVQRIYTYIELSKAIGEHNLQQAMFFTQKAVDLSRNNEQVPEILLLKAMGEHIIAHWMAGQLSNVLSIYEEAVERLLNADKNNEEWQAAFMSFGHALGYICSDVVTGSPPDSASDGKEYVAPCRGFFIVHRPLIAKAYKSESELFLPAHLGIAADHFNKREEAIRWTLEAFDLARNKGAQGSVGMIGVRALPLLLEEKEYALALDVALEVQILFAMYHQGSTHADPEEVLGVKPNKIWNDIEENGANFSIIPAILKLLVSYIYEPERARELAGQLQLLSNQMRITASSPEFWFELSNVIEVVFAKDRSYENLIKNGNSVSEWQSIKMVYYLAASYLSLPKDALHIFEACVSFLEGTYQSWKELKKRLIVPYVYEFWTIMVSRNGQFFENPEGMKKELEVFRDGEEDNISMLLATIKNGLVKRIN